jgi:hypothetical protein
MSAVRVSADHQPVIVGSPAYFESHRRPRTPRDLLQHQCINFRHGSAGVYRWESEKGKKSLSVAVNGPLIVDDVVLVLRAALDGVGLAFLAEHQVDLHLKSGALVRVLESWCQPYPGFFLYYPSRRQQPPPLVAERSANRRGLAVGETTAGLLGACVRLIELVHSPEDISFFASLTQRGMVYRLIRTPQADRLRAIATMGDLSQRTARAIAWLRDH